MDTFNALSHEEAVKVLCGWCACRNWSERVAQARPFENVDALRDVARHVWWKETAVAGWLEAYLAHPKIGDVDELRRKFHGNAEDSEQAAALASNDKAVLEELARCNRAYEEKFGHIFIICAAGKPANAILAEIKRRFPNTPHEELANAAGEQMKITESRMCKFFATEGTGGDVSMQRRTGQIHSHLVQENAGRSPVTSHVLDIGLGRPAAGVPLKLQKLFEKSDGVFETIGEGVTNADGRVPTLLNPSRVLEPGTYRVRFDTRTYQHLCGVSGFYPICDVTFQIQPHQVRDHFHVPLTYSPFGYSTYRGS